VFYLARAVHKFDFMLLTNCTSNNWWPLECDRRNDECLCLSQNTYVSFEGQPGDKGLPTNAVKDKAIFVSRQQQALYKVSENICLHHHDNMQAANDSPNRSLRFVSTVMRRTTTFRSTTDRIYDGGPIRLRYYNIVIRTIVLQLPTVFSTVTCCTGL
jgi:hypothetical protein